MISSMGAEEFSEIKKRSGRRPSPNGLFAAKAVQEFLESGADAAEVVGWPTGEPRGREEVNRYAMTLRFRAAGAPVKVSQRGDRLFLLRKEA